MTRQSHLGFAPGVVVAGRYQIESLLGEGGYGAVYVASQHPLGRKVALKILHPDVLVRQTARERFVREAQLTQQLTHPNVVRLFDFGATEQGVPFIVWELLEGRSIEDELGRSGPLSPARIVRITQQILKALAEAHQRGIIHRDIKPANIFLCDFAGEPDFVKVLDFGIAAGPREGTGSGLTQEGVSLGTPAYMPPEQVLDEPLDGRADLYAVGLLMSEMATGQPVFRGENVMQIAMQQLDGAPAPHAPAVLASPLGAVIARATQKEPSARFGSALDMLQALAVCAAGGPFSAPDTLQSAGWQPPTRATAFAPTVGQPTPAGGLAAIAPSPQGYEGPRPATVSAHLIAPRAAAPRSTVPWVAFAVIVSLAALATGIAVLVRESGRASEGSSKHASKASAAPDKEPEEKDPFDDLPNEIAKGVMKSMLSAGKCPPLSAKVAAFSVQGLSVEQVLARFAAAGFSCAAHNDFNNFGNFMLTGKRTIWLHYGKGELVVVKGQPKTRSLTDPNGNVIVLLGQSDDDAQKASEIAAGKRTSM